jgi:hypothetical protein
MFDKQIHLNDFNCIKNNLTELIWKMLRNF